jgi:hypothetical protein
MNRSIFLFLATVLLAAPAMAELPHTIQIMATQYDAGMKSYDVSEAARITMARQLYLARLNQERRYSEGGKRAKEVAAIDAEIKAVDAGPLAGLASADLPKGLHAFRDEYVKAPGKARELLDKARKKAGQDYLKWLDQMAPIAARSQDKAMIEAIASERKRVLEKLPADASPEPPKKSLN